jgi:methionyl aminopeptidase
MATTFKSEDEIAILREGGARHAAILEELVKKVVPGITTQALDTLAYDLVKKGGDYSAFLNYQPESADRPYPATLCVSVNDEVVHGIPNEGEKVLKEGDIVTLDLGLNHKGLITDAAVTVPVGKVSDEALRLMKATKEALDAGISAVLPGGHVGDIGAAIQAVAKKYNYGIAEGLAGHGVGYAVHEDPYIPNEGKVGKGEVLKPGMVFAIEPMFTTGKGAVRLGSDGYTFYTRDGSLAAHFEHTVTVTSAGVLVLTTQ